MINDADEYERLWAALMLASPMVLFALGVFLVALAWLGRRG